MWKMLLAVVVILLADSLFWTTYSRHPSRERGFGALPRPGVESTLLGGWLGWSCVYLRLGTHVVSASVLTKKGLKERKHPSGAGHQVRARRGKCSTLRL